MAGLVSVLALLSIGLLAAVVVFHVLLAAGLPLGRAAWGGQHRILPASLRAGSGVAAVALTFAAWVVATEAGFLPDGTMAPWPGIAIWVFAAFFALNTAGNLVSESRIERKVMAPITIALAVSFALTALLGS